MRSQAPVDQPWPEARVNTFMLADWAEALNGKLYVGGGGFDRIYVTTFDQPIRFFFAAILSVPWARTNERIEIRVWVETADAEETGFEVRGQMVAGRPPGARQGQDATVAFAGPVMMNLSGPRDLVLKVAFGGQERRLRFFVESVPRAPGMAPIGQA